jgi:hypothetical protein
MPPYIATTSPVLGSMEAPPARTYLSVLLALGSSLSRSCFSAAETKASSFFLWMVVVMR